MSLSFRPLHPTFIAEVGPIDLRDVRHEAALEEIRQGMDCYGVLVFKDQSFDDAELLAFAQRFDGELHTKTGISALAASRLGHEALTDISNLDEDGRILDSTDRRRVYGLGNRLWHTDASFQDPPGGTPCSTPGWCRRCRPTLSMPTLARPTTGCPRRRRSGWKG